MSFQKTPDVLNPKFMSSLLKDIYDRLLKAFGPQHWWPAQTPFEVMVGAVLTQNTNWGNVEKALDNLKEKKCLSIEPIHALPPDSLAALIKPAGYFNVKARRLKNLIDFIRREYKGSLQAMSRVPLSVLRPKLLEVNGVGPETADSILLYALDKPVFVVDAYTKRIFYRHNVVAADADYHGVQELFTRHLDHDIQMFNEYHALLVRLGKDYCKPRPRCDQCPLKDLNYSTIYKCGDCHRALLRKAERRVSDTANHSGYLCRFCAALSQKKEVVHD